MDQELIELAVIFLPASNANSHSHCLRFAFSANSFCSKVFKFFSRLTFDKQWKLIMNFSWMLCKWFMKGFKFCVIRVHTKKNFNPSVNEVNHVFPFSIISLLLISPNGLQLCYIAPFFSAPCFGEKRGKNIQNQTVFQFGAAAGNCCLDLSITV